MSAQTTDHGLLFNNKTSEQMKPKKKEEEPIEPEESLFDVENVEQRIAGQSSSLTVSKSAPQTVPGSTEGSQQSSGEAELVQLSSTANDLQSATHTALDLLDERELLPLKQRSSGVKTETVETLSIASLPINQSTTDASALDLTNLSGELPLNRLSLGIKAEPVATPSNVQSASDCLDFIEDIPLTLQQREAISRRHHLKFITGHYGSGKVIIKLETTTSYL